MRFKVGDEVIAKDFPSWGTCIVYRIDRANRRCSVHLKAHLETRYINVKVEKFKLRKEKRSWRRKRREKRVR